LRSSPLTSGRICASRRTLHSSTRSSPSFTPRLSGPPPTAPSSSYPSAQSGA
jgi:hypothetical protein